MDTRRLTASSVLATILTGVVCVCYATTVFANHPVLVEGEQDFDGDGLIGPAEDADNDTDQSSIGVGAVSTGGVSPR